MSTPEIPNSTDLIQSMYAFVRRKGINNYIVKGQEGDVPTVFSVFAGLYASRVFGERPMCLLTTQHPRFVSGLETFYDKLLSLTLPERVARLRIYEDRDMRRQGIQLARLNRQPYVVVGFGLNTFRRRPVVLMATIPGMTPQAALDKIKATARGNYQLVR